MTKSYNNFTQEEKKQALNIINKAYLANKHNHTKPMLQEVEESLYGCNIARKGEMMFGENALDYRDVANSVQDKFRYEVGTGQFGAGFYVTMKEEQ